MKKTSPNIAYFKAPTSRANFELGQVLVTGVPIKDEYTALVATEGKFTDSTDVEHEFTPERLQTIVEHTNKAIDSGTVVPVCADHKKDIPNTIGSISGRAFTKIITPEDLPNQNSQHLVGKLGMFLSGVKVAAAKGIEALKSGVKSVSMGLNLDPNEHRIMELSLVPIPAIPNMGLFHKKVLKAMSSTANFSGIPDSGNAVTWDELEANDQAIDDLQDEYNEICQKLWLLLKNAYDNDGINIDSPEVLLQLIYSQLNGFSVKIIELLGLTSLMQQMNQTAQAGAMAPQDQAAQTQAQLQGGAESGMTIPQLQQQTTYKRGSNKLAQFNLSKGTNKKYVRGSAAKC
jgi:hypothetical protein